MRFRKKPVVIEAWPFDGSYESYSAVPSGGTGPLVERLPGAVSPEGSADDKTSGMDTVIVRSEELAPGAFLRLIKSEPGAIKRARVMAPRLGSRSFGRIKVEYVTPRLRRR